MNNLSAILPKILDEPRVSKAIQAADELPTREDRWGAYVAVAFGTGDEHLISFVFGKIALEYGVAEMATETGIDDDFLRRLVLGIAMPSQQMMGAIIRAAGITPTAIKG